MVIKSLKSNIELQKHSIKQELEVWLNSETGKTALYSIGSLLGAGIKDQIITKGASKTNLKAIGAEILGDYVKRFLHVPQSNETPQSEPPPSNQMSM